MKQRGGTDDLVYAQCSKGQRFTGLSVDQQDFSVQDHAVTSGERLRDVVLKVRHLKRQMQKGKSINETGLHHFLPSQEPQESLLDVVRLEST